MGQQSGAGHISPLAGWYPGHPAAGSGGSGAVEVSVEGGGRGVGAGAGAGSAGDAGGTGKAGGVEAWAEAEVEAALGAEEERLLVLDCWPETEPCWGTLDAVWRGVQAIDAESGRPRGCLIVSVF